MTNSARNRLLGSVAILAVAVLAARAQAQTSAVPAASVSEVVVTAEKRSERLADVAASVSVLPGATLEQMQATRLEDWAGYVPGLVVADAGAPGQAFIAIDGIAPLGAASEVGLYVNETPIGSSSSFQGANGFSMDLMPYDLDRIELLRGPQGTLYGASTMGGLIKYVLSEPNLTTFSGRVGADIFGVEDAHAPGGGVRGEVNLPLIADKLALRISGYDENTPGFIDDATTGQKGDNAVRQGGGRLALLWRPQANFSVELGAIYQNTQADNLDFVALNTVNGAPLAGGLDNINTLPEPYNQSLQLYDATIKWNLSWAELTSITSYESFTNNTTEDLTDYIGVYLGYFGAAGPGTSDFHEDYRLKKFTQEVRIASPEGRKLEWLAGAYYTHETGSNYEVFNTYSDAGAPLAGLNPLEFVLLPSTYEEAAVFGHAAYHFNDMFELAGGVRYAHNSQTFTEYEGGALVGSSPLTAPALTVPGTSSEGVATFSVGPTVHLTKTTMLYGNVATGYQPGGPNVVLPGVTGVPSAFNSARLTDYQIGLKSTFLDGRASVDLSAYDIDWTKIQVAVLIGNTSAIENAGAARSEGVDLSGAYSPLPGLKLRGSLSYTDAMLTSAVASIGAAYGARLPYVPMWSGALTADYLRPITAKWNGFIGGGYRYTGSRYSAVEGSSANGEPQGLEVGSYGVVDAHIGVTSGGLKVAIFAKNLLDKRAYLTPASYFFDALGSPIDIKAPVLTPLTVGLRIDKSF